MTLPKLEIRKFIMPFPICHTCGNSRDLDAKTYDTYEGSVTCGYCRSRMQIRTYGGELRECSPFVDPDLSPPDDADTSVKHWDAYFEALKCLVGDAPKGCAVMCRLALQHALMARGIAEAPSQNMINNAKSKGVLAGKYGHMADSVGFFGGKAGHPQDEEIFEVTPFEATHGLRVLRELLLMLFPGKPIDPNDLPFE